MAPYDPKKKKQRTWEWQVRSPPSMNFHETVYFFPLVGGFLPPILEKDAQVKMGSSSPRVGMKIPKMFELPTNT